MEKNGLYPQTEPPPAYRYDMQQCNTYPIPTYQTPQVSNQQNNQHQPTPSPPTVVEPQGVYVVSGAPAVGPKPQMITCPSCHASVFTRVEFESTTKTHLLAGLLCLLCCLCCVCIPYCVDSCQNCNHYCPSCKAYIGTHNK